MAAAMVVLGHWREPQGRGKRWFGAWAVAGALMSFSFLTGFSIGLFVLPVAALVLLLTARSSPHLREASGLVSGIGITLLVVWLVNRDYRPCPPDGLSIPPGAPPGTSVSCGGFDATSWLYAGAVVITVGIVAYTLAGVLAARGTQGHP